MYETYADDIFRFLFVHVRDEALAKDLTSETFLRAWKAIDTFDFKHGRAWLYRIAQNAMTDHWRKKRAVPLEDENEIIDERQSIEDSVDQTLNNERLLTAVDSLPTDLKTIVTLRFINGYSAKQVAGVLDLSEANIRVKQFRALRKLRELLR